MPSLRSLAVIVLMSSLAGGGCDGCGSGRKAPPDAKGDGPTDSGDHGDAAGTDTGPSDAGQGDVAPTDAAPTDVAPGDVAPTDVVLVDTSTDVATDVGGTDANGSDLGPTCITVDAGTDGGCLVQLAVFGTGVDGTGVPLPGGSVDPHYTLIQSAESTLPGPNAIVVSQIAEGYWVAQSTTSKWIAPSANQAYPGADPCNAAGNYVYRTTFDLTGYVATTAKLVGSWGADNTGVAIRLNGTSLGLSAPGYAPLTAFTIESGFAAGRNTLDFEINDFGCPNGLRVDLSGTALVSQ
jgi:hypothetical protein